MTTNGPTEKLAPSQVSDANTLRDAYRDLRRSDSQPRCGLCNQEPKTPDITVAAFPTPWRDHSDRVVLCHECWAKEASDETVLSPDQAQVIAVQSLGYSREEMASATGGWEDDVDEHLSDLASLRREIESEMDDLMRTAKLFDRV